MLFLKIINYVRILMFKKGLRNNRSGNNEAKPHLTVRMRLRKRGYLPIQKLEKIRPSRSSEVNSPVISLKFCCARRNSSASSSPARLPTVALCPVVDVPLPVPAPVGGDDAPEAAFHVGVKAHALFEMVTQHVHAFTSPCRETN